jgi:hypothetical protein
MRLIGMSERHPKALARNRDRKVQLCALAAGIDCSFLERVAVRITD